MMRCVFAFLLACAIARADALSDLTARLAAVSNAEPVSVNVRFHSTRIGESGADAAAQEATLQATDGPDGFQIRWARDLIQPVVHATGNGSPSARRAVRESIDGLRPTEIYEYLNIAGALVHVLNQAELVEEGVETWKGRPARRLSLKLTPPLTAKDRKYIKELTATATVWLDDEGWPVAGQRTLQVRGRALLVISFEQKESETYEFARVAGRLVTLRHEKTSEGSGGGESGGRKTVATLELAGS